jgi:hypothetical protein
VLRVRVHIDARLWFSCYDSEYNELFFCEIGPKCFLHARDMCLFCLLFRSGFLTPGELGAIFIVGSYTHNLQLTNYSSSQLRQFGGREPGEMDC